MKCHTRVFRALNNFFFPFDWCPGISLRTLGVINFASWPNYKEKVSQQGYNQHLDYRDKFLPEGLANNTSGPFSFYFLLLSPKASQISVDHN